MIAPEVSELKSDEEGSEDENVLPGQVLLYFMMAGPLLQNAVQMMMYSIVPRQYSIMNYS